MELSNCGTRGDLIPVEGTSPLWQWYGSGLFYSELRSKCVLYEWEVLFPRHVESRSARSQIDSDLHVALVGVLC